MTRPPRPGTPARQAPAATTRRVVVAVLLGVLVALGYAAPAAAHGADAPAAVDYVVTVESVSVPGVAVRAVEGGARLELRSGTDRTVVVLGLQGEPFLRIGPDGVEENRRSPTWAASRSLTGRTAGGPGDPAAAAPDWRRVSTRRTVRWHDERARELPARAWSVPLEVDGTTPGIVRGTVRRAAPPLTGWWWSGSLLAAVAVAAALAHPALARPATRRAGQAGAPDNGGPNHDGPANGFTDNSGPNHGGPNHGGREGDNTGGQGDAGAGGRSGVVGIAAIAGVAAVAGAVTVTWIVASAGLATSPVESLGTQLLARLWPLLTGLGVLAAAALQALRRPAADIVTAIAGACLAVMTGFADAAVFSNGSLAGPGWSRWAVATALAGGLALLAAGGIRWYRTPAVTAAITAGVEPDREERDHTILRDK